VTDFSFPTPRPLRTDLLNRCMCAGTIKLVAGSGTPEAGYQDGKLTEARFNNPMGLVCREDGSIYVCDSGNNRLRLILEATNVVSTALKSQYPGIRFVALSESEQRIAIVSQEYLQILGK
jgi:hypothetical protein